MKAFVVMLGLFFESPALAQQFGANDAPMLNLIGTLEAPRGFSDVVESATFYPEVPIEEKTIAQVLAYQESLRAAGTTSTAVGRYQFIYVTLSEVVDRLDIDKNLIFDSEMQTYLARHLLHECGYYDVDARSSSIANCLAGRWAALPLVDGPNRGVSAHQGVGENKALTNPEMVIALIEERFVW